MDGLSRRSKRDEPKITSTDRVCGAVAVGGVSPVLCSRYYFEARVGLWSSWRAVAERYRESNGSGIWVRGFSFFDEGAGADDVEGEGLAAGEL